MMLHQSNLYKNISISYLYQDTIGIGYMKMDSHFTPPIVTPHPLLTILGQWYFTMNWNSIMTPQLYMIVKNVKG